MPRKKKDEQEPKTDAAGPTVGAPQADPYPFLRTPAEAGGVIIDTDEAEATTPMTREDIDAANEEMYTTSTQLREEEANRTTLLADEKRAEASLKGIREAIRKNEEHRLLLGSELATFAEEIHTGLRKITIKVVRTVTKGNELVITDARDGKERERRTATAEELEWASGKNAVLFAPELAPDHPRNRPVTVSVLKDGYKGTRRGLAKDMMEVFAEGADDDAEPYAVKWVPGDAGRTVAIVPAWVAERLRTISDPYPTLGFRMDAGDTAAPPTQADPETEGPSVSV